MKCFCNLDFCAFVQKSKCSIFLFVSNVSIFHRIPKKSNAYEKIWSKEDYLNRMVILSIHVIDRRFSDASKFGVWL